MGLRHEASKSGHRLYRLLRSLSCFGDLQIITKGKAPR